MSSADETFVPQLKGPYSHTDLVRGPPFAHVDCQCHLMMMLYIPGCNGGTDKYRGPALRLRLEKVIVAEGGGQLTESGSVTGPRYQITTARPGRNFDDV